MNRHTPKRRREPNRAARWTAAVITAAVLCAGALSLVWLAAGPQRPATAQPDQTGPGCAATPQVRVASTAGFAPVLSAVARESCIVLTVVPAEGSAGAALLTAGKVDAWVPDSRERAFLAGPRLAAQAPSTATSPVVLAASATTSAAVAAQLGDRPSWGLVLAGADLAPLQLGIEDPATSSVALALAARLVGIASSATHDRDTGLATTAAAMSRLRAVSADEAVNAPDGQLRIVEERLVRPDLTKDSHTDTIIATAEGSPALDYPWVRAPGANEAADVLLEALLGPAGLRARADHGFREPGVSRFSSSSTGGPSSLVPPPAVRDIPILYALADAGGKRGNTLAVVDISGSMNEDVPSGDQPLITYVRESVGTSLNVLSDRTKIGLWQFGSRIHAGYDYQELVPIAPLATNRARMVAAGAGLRARDTGTGLYNTTLAAYLRVQRGYDPAANNIVTIFTDGRNEDSTGLDLPRLLSHLRSARDPRRPVSVLFIAYGNADRAAMARIVDMTGGAVFPISRPTQIIGALMAATARSVIEEQRG